MTCAKASARVGEMPERAAREGPPRAGNQYYLAKNPVSRISTRRSVSPCAGDRDRKVSARLARRS